MKVEKAIVVLWMVCVCVCVRISDTAIDTWKQKILKKKILVGKSTVVQLMDLSSCRRTGLNSCFNICP